MLQNSEGYFVFRYLLVDIPSKLSYCSRGLVSETKVPGTRDSNPIRVFVERAPGVRDNEPVMRWISH